MATGYELVAQQRCAVADVIEGFDDEQASTPSLCAGWTVHQTAAHLLTFTHLPLPKLMFEMAKAGFNYDKAADRLAKRFAAENTPAQVAGKLRERAGKENMSKSFPPEMTTSDVTVHLQDIRRPLGLGTDLDAHVTTTVLDFLTTHKQAKAIVTPGRVDGLALTATDTDWSFGSGEPIAGTAEAVMMALAGRDTFNELDGAGVAVLRERD